MSDNIREVLAETICEWDAQEHNPPLIWDELPESYKALWRTAGDAILARFPYMSADRSLYDYADSLRTQLNAANTELEKGDKR